MQEEAGKDIPCPGDIFNLHGEVDLPVRNAMLLLILCKPQSETQSPSVRPLAQQPINPPTVGTESDEAAGMQDLIPDHAASYAVSG